MQLTRTVVLFLMTGVPISVQGAEPELPVTVCDALTSRLQYSGHIIAIRGQVKPGGHGAYMAPASGCSHELTTRGVVWPNIINLAFANNRSPIEADHASFSPDFRAIRAADKYLATSGFRPGVDIEIATYVGLFVTYPDLEKRVTPGVAGALRLGFGPAGMGAPAQLLIKTIEDVAMIRAQQR